MIQLFSASCKTCGKMGQNMLPTDYHTLVCTNCGTEHPGYLTTCENNGAYQSVLVPTQTYTRLKRFRKYLARAGKSQCASSVPKETWEYLLANGPYSCPGAIVRALKKAGKKLKKKCYDSLPFLCEQVAGMQVPSLNELDKFRAEAAFKILDCAYSRGEPFVSYLYAIEYILIHIGRADILPFINKIQCTKRRYRYKIRMDRIYQ